MEPEKISEATHQVTALFAIIMCIWAVVLCFTGQFKEGCMMLAVTLSLIYSRGAFLNSGNAVTGIIRIMHHLDEKDKQGR